MALDDFRVTEEAEYKQEYEGKKMKGQEFEDRISNLDVSLFDQIESQTSINDKKSLIVVQNAVRSFKDSYVYLEIGSYLGGSIQPYLLDYKCVKIFSIDKRPLVQLDERWVKGYQYPGNSTQRMLDNLRGLTMELSKIECFDSDASNINRNRIIPKPDICFIDGEHTNRKVVSDFQFCKSVLNDCGVIIFHDAQVVAEGIDFIIESLGKEKATFKAYYLPDSIFVLDFTKNELIFKKIQSQDLKIYAFPSFMKILRRKFRKLPQPIKNIIKLCLEFFKVK